MEAELALKEEALGKMSEERKKITRELEELPALRGDSARKNGKIFF